MQSLFSGSGNRLQISSFSQVAVIAVAYAFILWVLRSSLLQLHGKWTQWDQAYSHGYLLVFVCLLFIFKETTARAHPGRFSFLYGVLAVIPSLLWIFGYATQTGAIEQIALPAFLACLVLTVTGLQRAVGLMFPFALLYLAIPLWEVLTPFLQNMATVVSTFGVRLLGVPAYIDGYSFTLPHGTVLIAGSCAGLRYFLMGVVLSSINAMYHRFKFSHAVLTIGLMAVLSVAGNWARVYSLILIAYYSDMQSSLVYEHGAYGWWIFAGLFLLYMWLTRKVPTGKGRSLRQPKQKQTVNAALLSTVLTLVFALALPVWVLSGKLRNEYQHSPLLIEGFQPVSAPEANYVLRPHFKGFDIEEFLAGTVNGYRWLIGRKTYVDQSQGKELVSVSNYISDEVATGTVYRLPSGNRVRVETIEGRTDKLVVSSFIIGGEFEINSWSSKKLQFRELLSNRSSNALWYAVTNCSSYRCDQELENLGEFLAPIDLWMQQSALYAE